VPMSVLEPGGDEIATSLQVHEPDLGADQQARTVLLLQSGRGKNQIFILCDRVSNYFPQSSQPRLTIRIGERNAAAHLLDIGSRMEFVTINEVPPELLREEPAYGGLSSAGDSH